MILSTPGGAPVPAGVYEMTLMLVERHGYNLFHRVGMEHEIDEREMVDWDWKYRKFHVGGPGRVERVRFTVSSAGLTYTRSADGDTREGSQVWIFSSGGRRTA
jgi:hypothetical protein